MKLLCALITTAIGTSAFAEAWETRCLAYKGGTRPLIVEPEEAQFKVAAYGTFESGAQILIGCDILPAQKKVEVLHGFIQLWAGGLPDFGSTMNVVAEFPGNQILKLGEFRYSRGSYRGELHPSFVALAATGASVSLSDASGNYGFEVPLDGAAEALASIKCNRIA